MIVIGFTGSSSKKRNRFAKILQELIRYDYENLDVEVASIKSRSTKLAREPDQVKQLNKLGITCIPAST
jgi:hypothetical protein